MKNVLARLAIVLTGLIGGCANLPDATVGYYLAESKVSFTVVRTVACDVGKNLIDASTVEPKVRHFADTKRFETVSFAGLKGAFADSDVKFEFYDDGRLKGVNATSEGKGEEILKTAITLAKTLISPIGAAALAQQDACAFIEKNAGEAKVLTLTYEGEVGVDRDTATHGQPRQIPANVTSKYHADMLDKYIGGVCATVESIEYPRTPAVTWGSNAVVRMKARQPAFANMKVMVGPANHCSKQAWTGKLPVAQLGTDYVMPIPSPALFGKQVFAATFADSGALGSVQYLSTTGAGQLLNVGSALATALQGKTTSEKVAEAQAKADLILQQQRVVLCEADPKSCK